MAITKWKMIIDPHSQTHIEFTPPKFDMEPNRSHIQQ